MSRHKIDVEKDDDCTSNEDVPWNVGEFYILLNALLTGGGA